MRHGYRFLHPGELEAPQELQPAVVLDTTLDAIAERLTDTHMAEPGCGNRYVIRDRDGRTLLLELDGIQLAFVAYDERPDLVHVFVKDSVVGHHTRRLETLLRALPIRNVRGDWWSRQDQPGWPGNSAQPFYFSSYGSMLP